MISIVLITTIETVTMIDIRLSFYNLFKKDLKILPIFIASWL